ncbi:hypothetical protein BAMA111019_16825 [Bacillus manliponensis]
MKKNYKKYPFLLICFLIVFILMDYFKYDSFFFKDNMLPAAGITILYTFFEWLYEFSKK